jgi:hypothetical protein
MGAAGRSEGDGAEKQASDFGGLLAGAVVASTRIQSDSSAMGNPRGYRLRPACRGARRRPEVRLDSRSWCAPSPMCHAAPEY